MSVTMAERGKGVWKKRSRKRASRQVGRGVPAEPPCRWGRALRASGGARRPRRAVERRWGEHSVRAAAPPCRNGPPLQNGAVRICPIGELKIRGLETERGLCYHSVLCNASVPPSPRTTSPPSRFRRTRRCHENKNEGNPRFGLRRGRRRRCVVVFPRACEGRVRRRGSASPEGRCRCRRRRPRGRAEVRGTWRASLADPPRAATGGALAREGIARRGGLWHNARPCDAKSAICTTRPAP